MPDLSTAGPAPAAPPRGGLRWVQLLLTLALLQLQLLEPPPAPVLVLPAPPPPRPAPVPGLEPAFAGSMTPDDVARGILALSQRPAAAGGLREDQRAALRGPVAEARAARAEVDRLRAAARAARAELRAAGLTLLAAAPPAARDAARAAPR